MHTTALSSSPCPQCQPSTPDPETASFDAHEAPKTLLPGNPHSRRRSHRTTSTRPTHTGTRPPSTLTPVMHNSPRTRSPQERATNPACPPTHSHSFPRPIQISPVSLQAQEGKIAPPTSKRPREGRATSSPIHSRPTKTPSTRCPRRPSMHNSPTQGLGSGETERDKMAISPYPKAASPEDAHSRPARP